MSARAVAAVVLALSAGGCEAAAPARKAEPARSEPLRVSRLVPLTNAGFEAPPRSGERCAAGWACNMHADPESFAFRLDATRAAEGRQSLCVERVRPEPWALATTVVNVTPELRGRRLRFSMALRVDSAEGAGAGPWFVVHGPQGNLEHAERPVKSTQGWERVSLEVPVAATAQMVEVGMTLLGGGRACIDDARLEVLE